MLNPENLPITLLVLLLSFYTGHTQNEENDKSRWTPEDIIHTDYARSMTFSPDNKLLLWTKRKAVKKKDRFVSDIYLTRLDTRKEGEFLTVQLTHQDENDHSPFFSRDGETIYFLSSRDEGKKLWSMSIYGGEAEEVHEFKNGISNIQWLSDDAFAFVANDGKTLYEEELEDKKDNVIVVEDSLHWKIDRLYRFDLKEKKISRLTENRYPVAGYQASHDGRWVVYTLIRSRHYAADAQPKPAIYLHDLESGEKRRILEDYQTPGNLAFTADDSGFYFSAVTSSDPEWQGAGAYWLYYYDLENHQVSQAELDWEWGLSYGSFEVVGQDVIASLANGPLRKLAFYHREENSWTKSDIDLGDKSEHVSILEISDDHNKVAYSHSTAAQLPEYYVADLQASEGKLEWTDEQRLLKLNEKLKSKPTARYEVFRWEGYQGEEVNGMLYYPEDYEEGKRYPLMLSIHGGPTGVDQDAWSERWSTYPQILSQRGAFVLKPNYHGSGNHGQAFAESIKKNYYTPELTDMIKGIEVLHERGLIDTSRLGTMGWSNGAILTTMLTVRHPDMFKVACPGAGDVNWTSDYGTCRFGVQFDQSYFGGAPWDDTENTFYNVDYIEYSPLFEMEKVKTPTIIFHGSEDRAVPRDQGWEYYRALQQVGKAPVRFLWFPDQPHGLQKITHQLRKMNEELDWIDRYLFNKTEDDNEAFKEESPLAERLKMQKAAKTNGLYGQLKNKVLVPEVVPVAADSISIGRFEVTNAQFKAFDPAFDYPEDKGNYPAIVNHARAEDYTVWLSQKTGTQYRLPNKKEAEKLHEAARKNPRKENTLNYWAGYDITADEVDLLRQKLEEVETSLVDKVGQHAAKKVGDASVYDLGGNVAEYAADGTTYGYSAYDYVDPFDPEVNPKPAHTGFRVILGKK